MPKKENIWDTDELLHEESEAFENSGEENFSLEDILAEFGSGKEAHLFAAPSVEGVCPPKKTAPILQESVIDETVFLEVKKEAARVEEPAKEPEKKHRAASIAKPARRENPQMTDWDFPEDTTKKAELSHTENEKLPEAEKKEMPKAHEEKAAEMPHRVAQGVRMPRKANNARLDETLKLNEFFESEEEYEEDEPEFEKELPGEYVKRNAMHVRKIAIRSVFALLLCLPMCALSFAENLGLPLPGVISYGAHPFRFLLALSGMQLIVMILHCDILGHGLKKLFTLRADVFSVVAVSSIAALVHAVSMMIDRTARAATPFCAVSAVALSFAGYGLYLRESGRLRACKAASMSKSPLGIFIAERAESIHLIKHPVEETEFFTKYIQMSDGAEQFWTYLSPILLIAALVFAGISSFGTGNPGRFFWAFSAISSVATPFFLLLCYPLPFSKITKRLAQLGAAIAGWYAAFSLSGERKLVIRDRDIYPKGRVTLHGLKVFGNHSLEKAVSYATSMIHEAKSGLEPVFGELLRSQYGKCESVYHLMHHESGGMEADICGDHVLLGTAGFMLRAGVRVSEKANVKNALFLAVNEELAAVFNLQYKLAADIRLSLESIVRSRVAPVMAVVDCNQNPVMLESELHVRQGSVEYPRVEERLDLASDEQFFEYDPCALITRAGMTPFANAVLAARRLRRVTVRNVVLSCICAVIGMLFMFYITFVGSYESGGAYNVFLYLLLWTLPVYLLSVRSGTN